MRYTTRLFFSAKNLFKESVFKKKRVIYFVKKEIIVVLWVFRILLKKSCGNEVANKLSVVLQERRDRYIVRKKKRQNKIKQKTTPPKKNTAMNMSDIISSSNW